jgi:hypothetical protein
VKIASIDFPTPVLCGFVAYFAFHIEKRMLVLHFVQKKYSVVVLFNKFILKFTFRESLAVAENYGRCGLAWA